MTFMARGQDWARRAWLPLGIFTLAAGLRLLLSSTLLGFGPAEEFFSSGPVFSKYPWIAARIAQHAPLGDRILDFSPLYTFLTTLLAALFPGDRAAFGLFQILLGSASCALAYQAATISGGRTAGVVSGVVALFYAPFLLYERVLEPEALIIFLNLLSLVLLLWCLRLRASAWWSLPGMTLGLSFVTRPNILVFLLCVLLWLLLTFRGSPRRLAGILAWFGAGLCLTIAPVLARNYRLSAEVLAPLMSSGQVLYQGNNPTAKGFYGSHPYLLKEMEVDPAINRDNEPDYAHELYRQFAGKPPEAAGAHTAGAAAGANTESYWFGRSRNFARQHPAAFLRLLGEKFRAFWSRYEIHDVLPLYDLEWEMDRLPLLRFGVVVPFALLGMALAAAEFRRHFLLYGFVLNYLVSNLMFFVSSRQRLLVIPFLVIFAAVAVSRGRDTLRSGLAALRRDGAPRSHWTRAFIGTTAGALALLCFAVAVNRPSPQLEQFTTFLHLNRDSKRHLAQAQAAWSAGNRAEALPHFRAAFDLLPFHPTRVPNRYLGGDREKYAGAIRFWEEALARKRDNAYARFTLGYLLFQIGDYERALAQMRPLADAGEEFFLGYLLPIAQPRFYVARCREQLGDTAGAKAEYERLEREHPGLPWVAARLIVLSEIAGDGGRARALRDSLERLDNPISSSYLLAEAYRDRGECRTAIRTLEQAPQQLLDRSAPYHFLLSACFAREAARNDPGTGRDAVGASIRECRKGLRLGTSLNRIAPETAGAYRAALALDPGNPQLSYELGIVAFNLGDLETARQSLEGAICSRTRPLSDATERSARQLLQEIAVLTKSAT